MGNFWITPRRILVKIWRLLARCLHGLVSMDLSVGIAVLAVVGIAVDGAVVPPVATVGCPPVSPSVFCKIPPTAPPTVPPIPVIMPIPMPRLVS